MKIQDKIKQRRTQLNLTLEEVANVVGVTKATVQRWESGLIANMKRDKIVLLAKALKTSPAYILGLNKSAEEFNHNESHPLLNNLEPIAKQKLPLLGIVACGKPIMANEDWESYVEVGTQINADFCLKVKGDSMINARINDGDIVFVKQQSMVNNGEIAVVIIEDEATLKRVFYYPDSQKLVLQAENPKYEPLVYLGQELETIHILGKAIAFQSDVK